MNVFNILQLFLICVACGKHPSPESHSSVQVIREKPTAGAERLEEYLPLLKDKRIGCVVNHSSLVSRTHLVDTLRSSGIDVRVVFAPEHGFRGSADAGEVIADEKDPISGVPVISLYGSRKKPMPEDLKNLDMVVFDIQDVGVRFYTYISTLHYIMEACAENGVPLLLLDRPNPNGYYIDGPVLDPDYRSFVGMHPIPVVYGMTMGELARMINAEGWLANGVGCDLTVIRCLHYDHNMTYELPVAPSPNLPNLRAVLLYPSLCFFEGTRVSVGRGTSRQFQVLGHPDYPATDFTFTPVSMPGARQPPYKDTLISGTDLTNLTVLEIVAWKKLNLSWLIHYAGILEPQGKFFLNNGFFDKLAGSDQLRKQLIAGFTEVDIRKSWEPALNHFKSLRKKYLLYPDIRD